MPGIILISCAVVMIILGVLDSVLDLKISLLRSVFALILLALTIISFIKKHFFAGSLLAAFTFFAAEKDLAALLGIESGDIASNFVIYLSAILLGIGLVMIYNTVKYRRLFSNISDGFGFGNRPFGGLGLLKKSISAAELDGYKITNGKTLTRITVTNGDEYAGNATVYINGNQGIVELCVPSSWRIIMNDAHPNDLAGVNIRPQDGTPGKMLYLSVKNNKGSINVVS